MCKNFLLVGASLRWYLGKHCRLVEELVIAATGDEPGAVGDTVVNYRVNPVSCRLVNQRSVGDIVPAKISTFSFPSSSVKSGVYSSTTRAATR
jgi:hypothetical protein